MFPSSQNSHSDTGTCVCTLLYSVWELLGFFSVPNDLWFCHDALWCRALFIDGGHHLVISYNQETCTLQFWTYSQIISLVIAIPLVSVFGIHSVLLLALLLDGPV